MPRSSHRATNSCRHDSEEGGSSFNFSLRFDVEVADACQATLIIQFPWSSTTICRHTMGFEITNAIENFMGRLIEKAVGIAEFMCPPLKEFLSWEFVDDGTLFAVHDEDTEVAHSSKDGHIPSQAIPPSLKERGEFVRHVAATAA